MPSTALALIAFSFLIAAAAKSAQFPFHVWLPDAMEAPTPVSALIHAATMVNAGIYLLARFYPAFASVPAWKMSVILVGMISALIAALSALTASDLKRVLAYSTVSQLGYMVYAIGAGGVLASQFHLLSHAVFKALLFLAAGSVIHSVGTRDLRRMGRLGARMPFVRNVFIIGALALMGVPILNGFWSKELILEIGLEHSPIWAYAVMLLSAGLTAFYTFRMVWLVFFGRERDYLHVHAAGSAMKVSLGILAAGTFITWLFFGGLNGLLSSTLPFHELEHETLREMIVATLSTPATWLALLIVAVGFGISWMRARGYALFGGGWLNPFVESSFGFESLNRLIVRGTYRIAEGLSLTQTGELNWNILGIISALLVVLIVLWLGA
jgi:NADH-quinone oxidoreductase subunit L